MRFTVVCDKYVSVHHSQRRIAQLLHAQLSWHSFSWLPSCWPGRLLAFLLSPLIARLLA